MFALLRNGGCKEIYDGESKLRGAVSKHESVPGFFTDRGAESMRFETIHASLPTNT
jgi:hypothetical protein